MPSENIPPSGRNRFLRLPGICCATRVQTPAFVVLSLNNAVIRPPRHRISPIRALGGDRRALGGAKDLPLWFGAVHTVKMQMSFLSRPFGYTLLYLNSMAPPEVTMARICRSSQPFLLLHAVVPSVCIILPEVLLWLPRLVYG